MIGCFFTIFAYNYRLFYIKKYGMKRLFIIGICLCLSGMVSAQWHVGCEVGANWSTVKFPSYEMGGKRMTGFNIGAVGMYRWSERWGQVLSRPWCAFGCRHASRFFGGADVEVR